MKAAKSTTAPVLNSRENIIIQVTIIDLSARLQLNLFFHYF